MRLFQVLSATAAAGKTVWAVGLVRALRETGLRVAVFKAVSEDENGYEVSGGRVSLAALHLMAAAGNKPCGKINPVLLIPAQNNRAEVWLLGRCVGNVARLGRDTCLLDDLSPRIQKEIELTTIGCLEEVAANADIVISEGSGGATDLTLVRAWDLANVTVASLATAIVLVSRASQGGALAGLVGTTHSINSRLRSRLRGLALNDVRHRLEDVVAAGRLIALERGLTFLGATPWLPFFEGREQYAPFTPESDADHSVLGRAISESILMSEILGWMNLG